MEALSVAESEVADPAANCEAEEEAGEGEHDVGIEGYGVQAGLGREVPVAEGGTSEGACQPAVSTEDLVAVGEVRDGYVVNVGVMLDKVN